jgi:prepilin-type N-terminal cleavage/methylation domain-containing protein
MGIRFFLPKIASSGDLNMHRKKSSGLTILELITVLAIVGILIAIAGLNFSRFSSAYRLHEATREIASDLQFARLLAVKENRDIRVVFRTDSYEIMPVSDLHLVKSRNFNSDYPDILLTGLSVTFNSRGNAFPATITISNFMGSKQLTVTATGQVKYQ